MKYTSLLLATASATALGSKAGFGYDINDGSLITDTLANDLMDIAFVFGINANEGYWTNQADPTRATVWDFLGKLEGQLDLLSTDVSTMSTNIVNGVN